MCAVSSLSMSVPPAFVWAAALNRTGTRPAAPSSRPFEQERHRAHAASAKICLNTLFIGYYPLGQEGESNPQPCRIPWSSRHRPLYQLELSCPLIRTPRYAPTFAGRSMTTGEVGSHSSTVADTFTEVMPSWRFSVYDLLLSMVRGVAKVWRMVFCTRL